MPNSNTSNQAIPQKKKVFQAGYADGLNGWYSCGYGPTQQAARNDLKKRIHELSLQSVVESSVNFKTKYHRDLTAQQLAQFYDSHVEFLTSGRYIEKSYMESVHE